MAHFSPSRAWLALTAALVLTSCGGGGGSPALPAPPATPPDSTLTCPLGLQYANGSTSGIAIPESSHWTRLQTETSRLLSDCQIARLQSLQVRLCVKHGNTGDLQARITGPADTVQSVKLPSSPGTVSNACNPLEQDAQTIELMLDVTPFNSLSSANGQWLVQVRDVTSGFGTGTLIGWSLTLGGLP